MKKQIIVCDRCKRENVDAKEVTFVTGRSFDGVETSNDNRRIDLCFDCTSSVLKWALLKCSHDEQSRIVEKVTQWKTKNCVET